ncbi:TPA: hypothetical protein R4456_001748 [Campylobacter jejuni]|nr:hypothetical protein [Campylobacter jejuni]HDZ4377017.1 hypothetical protein [Campylobacter jejuni]HED4623075.1 hypothetical protein [Campylobacter jejuni]
MEILEKITYQDKENNLLILNNILDLLEDGLYKKKNTINDKFDLIFKQPKQFNDEYIKSHYLSIYRAIESVNKNRYFVFWEIANGMPQKIITQTIIYDMARFYNTIKHKEKLIDESLQYIVKEINNIIGSIQGLDDYYCTTRIILQFIWILAIVYTISHLSHRKDFFNPYGTREKNKVDDIW